MRMDEGSQWLRWESAVITARRNVDHWSSRTDRRQDRTVTTRQLLLAFRARCARSRQGTLPPPSGRWLLRPVRPLC